jgi:hypothetical protein
MAKKSRPAASTGTLPLTPSLADLKSRRRERPPKVKRLTRTRLSALASKLLGRKAVLAETPALELTARHPYDPAGWMDYYQPGRWDCTYNLLFMDTIVTGSSPGEWQGTAGYLVFKAPAAGTYLVVANFSGYKTTMRLLGPWGTNTAYTPTPSDTGTVTALWTASAATTLYFYLNCAQDGNVTGIGYLESVQVFRLS